MNKRFPLILISWSVLLVTIMYALPVRADVTEDQFDFEKLEDGTWSIRVRPDIFPSGEVIIPAYHEGIPVTAIADQGFNGQGLMTRVEIPETVTKLGEESFSWCPRLKCVNMPKSVAQIGRFCFSACQVLEEINIPEGVTQLEEYTFEGCTALKRIELPESLTQLGSHCFDGCEALANIILPSSLTNVKDMCFHGCKGLSSLELPKSLAYIGNAAFNGMELDRLTIHCSLTSKSDSKTIESPCKVKEIVFACEVPYLPQSQFELEKGCKIIFSSEVRSIADHAFESSECQSFEFSEGLESIGDYAFKKTGLTSIEIPSTVRSIGTGAFAGCKFLERIEIKDGLSVLGDGVFMGALALKVVKLPQTLVSIGKLTFFATGLEEIKLPDSLNIIGDGAFAAGYIHASFWGENDGTISEEVVKEIYNGDLRADIDVYGFELTDQLTKISFPNQPVDIGACAFSGMRNLSDFNLIASKIGDAAFFECSSFINSTITVTEEIGEKSFAYCSSFARFPNLDGTWKIGKEAFHNGLNIGTLRIPDSVKEIGKDAFAECLIAKLIIGKGLADIKDETFQNLTTITEIVFSEGVKSIGDRAFINTSITSLNLPEGLESIGVHAFDNSGLDGNNRLYNVTIPESVTKIGKSCFGNNLAIIEMMSSTPITLPHKNMGYDDESASKTLVLVPQGSKTIYISDDMWSGFTIKERGTGSVTITVNDDSSFWEAYSEQTDILPEDVLELKLIGPGYVMGVDFGQLEPFVNCMKFDFSEVRGFPQLRHNSFANRTTLKEIICSDYGTESSPIDYEAFESCVSLEQIQIPDNVDGIGYEAFRGCANLRRINIPSKLRYVGGYAFSESGFTDLDFSGSSIEYIDDNAFANCRSLQTVSFENTPLRGTSYRNTETGLSRPANGLFVGCLNLISVNMLNTQLEELGEEVFKDCLSLSQINMPKNLKSISDRAFANTTNLHYIVLPETLESIGEEAFLYSGLRSIKIPSRTEEIGLNALGSCNSLVSVTLPKLCTDLSNSNLFESLYRLRYLVSPAIKAPTVSENTFNPFIFDICSVSAPNNEETMASYMSDPVWSRFKNMDFSLVIESEMDDEWVDTSLMDTETYEDLKDEITQDEQNSGENPEQPESIGALNQDRRIYAARKVEQTVVQEKLLKVFAPVYDQMATTCDEDNKGYYVHIQPKGDAQIIKVEFDGKDVTSQLKDGMILLPAVKKSGKLKITTDKDGTSGIGTTVVNQGEKGVLYDLCGRRVHNPGKGIYIKDGKKVVL